MHTKNVEENSMQKNTYTVILAYVNKYKIRTNLYAFFLYGANKLRSIHALDA